MARLHARCSQMPLPRPRPSCHRSTLRPRARRIVQARSLRAHVCWDHLRRCGLSARPARRETPLVAARSSPPRASIRCPPLGQPLETSCVEHVSRPLWRPAGSSSTPTAAALALAAFHDRVAGLALQRTADIPLTAPRSATSPSANRCPWDTAAARPAPIADARQRLKSERALLPLRVVVLALDVCSFAAAARLSHGHEEHLGALQPAAMGPQWAWHRPVRASHCCPDSFPQS
jgi:hypothetical protein